MRTIVILHYHLHSYTYFHLIYNLILSNDNFLTKGNFSFLHLSYKYVDALRMHVESHVCSTVMMLCM